MRIQTLFANSILLFALACLALSPSATAQQTYSLDDWMTVSSVGSFVWSPDGTHFIYTSTAGDSGTTEIFRIALDGGEPVQISTNPPGRRPEPKQNMALSSDGSTIFFTSARYFQNYDNIFRMPATGGEAAQITFNDAVIETSPAPSPDGKTLAYFARTRQGTKLFLLDLYKPNDDTPNNAKPNSWPRLLEPGDMEERFPVWSPDGKRIAFARGGDIWIRDLDGSTSRRLIEEAYAGGNSSPVWSPDGSRIAFVSGKSGFSQIGVVHVATGRITPITYSQNIHSNVSWSPDGTQLTFVRNDDMGMSRHVVVARADGTGQPKLLTRGKSVSRSPQFSPDGSTVAYIESAGNRTAEIWKVPSAGGTPRQVTASMGKIDPADLSLPIEMTYPGPDNLPIPTLLYKPKDFNPNRKYPVIVRIHGHPGQWNHSFQMMWQYLVQKGFVMIAPNPRGSRGFGQGFHDLHIADYGGGEYADVMNVLDYLREQPYIDMTRKATWGGSGGGYLSLVIATKAPETFQAQVIRAPVSSWKLLAIDRFGGSGRTWTPTRTPRRERSEFGGSYEEIPNEYYNRSPLNFVAKVQVPQLLFQGLRDSSVPPRQSQVWAGRMRALGKAHLIDYVEYPDEDHSLRRYKATVRDMLVRMESFLVEHLRLPKPAR
ncbi:MAG: S9 family peptidase [Acidobacteria bacterium]|nr:S9 family peptidase [Acidobacteriota bacterium]